MSGSQYWVTIYRHDAFLGAGFFVMPRYVLTAGHCLREIQDEDTLDLHCADGAKITGKLYRRPVNVDLALIETSKPLESPIDLPHARPPGERDHWTNPYRPDDDFPLLSGIIAHLAVSFRCADGAYVDALQLNCQAEIGGYDGYSGSPIQREDPDGTALLGILLEQYLDRESPERATNVLFAATIKDALSRFDCFAVNHLLDVLDPRSVPVGTAVAAAVPADLGVRSELSTGMGQTTLIDASELVDKLKEWADSGLLDPVSVQEMTLRIAKSVVDAKVREMTR